MNQKSREQWIILPDQLPAVLKRCSKCGEKTQFNNSGKFRVNANGRLLDIWLIFRCSKCETSFNLAIYERMEAGRVDPAEYKGFLDNAPELALKYGNDRDLFARNRAEILKSRTEYRVEKGETARTWTEGETTEGETMEGDTMEAEVKISAGFDLRVDALLVRQLSVSRNMIKRWCEETLILSNGQTLSYKSKVKDSMVLSFYGPARAALTKT